MLIAEPTALRIVADEPRRRQSLRYYLVWAAILVALGILAGVNGAVSLLGLADFVDGGRTAQVIAVVAGVVLAAIGVALLVTRARFATKYPAGAVILGVNNQGIEVAHHGLVPWAAIRACEAHWQQRIADVPPTSLGEVIGTRVGRSMSERAGFNTQRAIRVHTDSEAMAASAGPFATEQDFAQFVSVLAGELARRGIALTDTDTIRD